MQSVASGAVKSYVDTAIGKFNYSTSEVDTGTTWIDGKKIYRKVCPLSSFTINVGSSAEVNATNLPSDVARFINAWVYAYNSHSSVGMFGCLFVRNIDVSRGKIVIHNLQNYASTSDTKITSDSSPYVVIEYIKS